MCIRDSSFPMDNPPELPRQAGKAGPGGKPRPATAIPHIFSGALTPSRCSPPAMTARVVSASLSLAARRAGSSTIQPVSYTHLGRGLSPPLPPAVCPPLEHLSGSNCSGRGPPITALPPPTPRPRTGCFRFWRSTTRRKDVYKRQVWGRTGRWRTS